ncbi:MAG: transglycosylase SLT domain-containing protein [Flavobacteriaceae bacterium]
MKKTMLFLFIIVSIQSFFCQETNSINIQNTTSIVQDTIRLTDPIISTEAMASHMVTETYVNADLSILSDDAYAKQIDDYWFNALENSSLNEDNNILANYAIDDTELDTETLKQRLSFLNSKTPFNVEYNEILERIIKRFLKNRKDKYAKLMAKATYYFPLIEAELTRFDIPLEMKYLAVIESALNPTAKSRVGASGLWQFMYATGKQFDLQVNSYVDERHDVLKATIAACKFLKQLHNTFGDWDLALAAYNSGPGNVSKAIRRSGGSRNYWNIRHFLPRETASYVPLFYTTMYIFEYANEHQIVATENVLQHFETDAIQVKEQISLDQITQAINVSKNTLKFLNPQYRLGIIPVIEGRNYKLVLPRKAIGSFVQNEDRIYAFAKADDAKREKPIPKLVKMTNKIRYKVRKGDFLGKIAKRYGVSVKKIKRWNGLKSTNLKIGQRLTIYPRRI